MHIALRVGLFQIQELLSDDGVLGVIGLYLLRHGFFHAGFEIRHERMPGKRRIHGEQFFELLVSHHLGNVLDESHGNEVVLVLLDDGQFGVDKLLVNLFILSHKGIFSSGLLLFGKGQIVFDEPVEPVIFPAVALVTFRQSGVESRSGERAVRKVDLHGNAVVDKGEIPVEVFDHNAQEGIFSGLSLHMESTVDYHGTVDGILYPTVHKGDLCTVLGSILARNVILRLICGACKQLCGSHREHK